MPLPNTIQLLDPLTLALIALVTFATSAFAAILGQGGGLMLMGVLSTTIPTAILVPFHGTVQAASNGSRAFFAFHAVNWPLITPLIITTVLGALLVMPYLQSINWQWMKPAIGIYILWSVWGRKLPFTLPGSLIGLAQGALGVLFGATGPLGNAYLLKQGLSPAQLISSNAVIMFVSHISKLIVFIMAGSLFFQYWCDLAWLATAAILGSFVGGRFRSRLSNELFFVLFKALLTLLAVNMVISIWI